MVDLPIDYRVQILNIWLLRWD